MPADPTAGTPRPCPHGVLTPTGECGALDELRPDPIAGTPDKRVTIDLEPIYWRGSPLLTWFAAVVAWLWALLLLALLVAGVGR